MTKRKSPRVVRSAAAGVQRGSRRRRSNRDVAKRFKKRETKNAQWSIRVPDRLKARIEKISTEENETRNEIVGRLLAIGAAAYERTKSSWDELEAPSAAPLGESPDMQEVVLRLIDLGLQHLRADSLIRGEHNGHEDPS